MPKSKKTKSRKVRIFILVGILALMVLAFHGYRIIQPVPVQAPTETAVPKQSLNGIYKGELPCADCPGVDETLVLAGTSPESGTYVMEDLYKEKSTPPFKTGGNWEIMNSNILKLSPDDKNSDSSYFQALDNGSLQMLDSNMQKIDSPFNQILTKQN